MAVISDADLPSEARECLREWPGDGWSAHPLAGDASVRTYYRVARGDGSTIIVAYYPLEVRGQVSRFLDAHRAVGPHARLPEVLRASESGIAHHDVGDATLFDLLHADPEEGRRRYGDAVDLLVAFQRAGDAGVNAAFDADF